MKLFWQTCIILLNVSKDFTTNKFGFNFLIFFLYHLWVLRLVYSPSIIKSLSYVSIPWELYLYFCFLPLPPPLRDENRCLLHFFVKAEIIFAFSKPHVQKTYSIKMKIVLLLSTAGVKGIYNKQLPFEMHPHLLVKLSPRRPQPTPINCKIDMTQVTIHLSDHPFAKIKIME